MNILIVNGPNLNWLGRREPQIYGTCSFEVFFDDLQLRFADLKLAYFQSNHEGALIDKLQQADDMYDGVVINPAAYSHTSIAIADCIRAMRIPVVEVHISDIRTREDFRHHSFTAEACKKCIIGHGLEGYAEAVAFLAQQSKN